VSVSSRTDEHCSNDAFAASNDASWTFNGIFPRDAQEGPPDGSAGSDGGTSMGILAAR